MATRYLGEWRGFRIYAEGSTLSWDRPGVPDPGPRGDLEPGESLQGESLEGVWFDEPGPIPEEIFQRALHPPHLAFLQFVAEMAQQSPALADNLNLGALGDTILQSAGFPPCRGDADREAREPDDGEPPAPPLASIPEWIEKRVKPLLEGK